MSGTSAAKAALSPQLTLQLGQTQPRQTFGGSSCAGTDACVSAVQVYIHTLLQHLALGEHRACFLGPKSNALCRCRGPVLKQIAREIRCLCCPYQALACAIHRQKYA